MNPTSRRLALAALSAAALPLAALAGETPAFPAQVVSARVGKIAFKENTSKAGAVAIARLEKVGETFRFEVTGRFEKFTKTGTGTARSLGVVVHQCADLRSATFPLSYAKGTPETGGATGTFSSAVTKKVGKGEEAMLVTTTSLWRASPLDSVPFTVTFTKWEPATMRISGKLGGTLTPVLMTGAKSNAAVKSGKFTAVATVIGVEEPPVPKAPLVR